MRVAKLAKVEIRMTSRSSRGRARSGIRLPLWGLGLIAVLGLTILVTSSIWLFRMVRSMASALEVNSPDFGQVVEPTRSTSFIVGEPASSPAENSPVLVSADEVKRWSGNERISILLLGIDQRCNQDGPTHTDTLMVLTIDPVGLSAAVLSLPRDLWVEIPDFGVDRINQAYYLGQIYEYPGGGPALATKTVETTLGITLDYFVAVNFDAFIEAVDLVGGITIDVPEAIDDPSYPDSCYGFDPFSIEAGVQQLDGETALKYARTRATFGGDVDRAGRQQAVILALQDQVMRRDQLPQLITKSLQLWQTFQANVRTDLSFEEALQLGLMVQDIPRSSIQTAVINFDYVYNETTPDGRQVLVPNREKIRELRDALFAPPAIPTPVIENLPALMAAEQARVAVYNGTAVFGLAAATQEYLQGFDINVSEIGNADSATYRSTQIIDYGTHTNTTLYLTQLMQVPPLNISNGIDPDGDFDVLIIIGNDWTVPGS
jgi:LCP family protein required for cell wall assembly